jgi:simple sugar transport system ATP-binding protein
MPPVPAIAARGITKRFPGVVANAGVEFEAAEGEVHALLGENGAGKTTLSHVLTGLYRADEGVVELHGQPVRFGSPRDAIDAGICMVHQHFRLVMPFSVAENVVLGDLRGEGRKFRVDAGRVAREVRELGEQYGLPVDPDARIWQLSVGEQQRVEILKALHQGAQVLILDEPTAVLTPQEAETLFATLRQMAAEGRTVIFISHKLQEVMAVSDRVTVLRGGHTVGTVATADSTARSLASLMVGRGIEQVHRIGQADADAAAVLELDDLWADGDRGAPAVRGVSLQVHAGEIVAVAGVSGNGQRELAEAIVGLRRPTRGTIRVAGRALRPGDPRRAIDAGIAYVPEDRLGTGVAPDLSLAENLALKSYRHGGPLLRLGRMRRHALDLIDRYDIKAPGPGAVSGQLSGGNVQKLVLAREFSGEPQVLVAASPTRGLDIGAIETVHRHLIDAAARGLAILLISEDLNEILALNDRIVVMYEGRLSRVVDRDDVQEIGLRMAGDELLAESAWPPASHFRHPSLATGHGRSGHVSASGSRCASPQQAHLVPSRPLSSRRSACRSRP